MAFSTDDSIRRFWSPVGNSDVPYALALSAKFVYFGFSPNVYPLLRTTLEEGLVRQYAQNKAHPRAGTEEEETEFSLRNWSLVYDVCYNYERKVKKVKMKLLVKRTC